MGSKKPTSVPTAEVLRSAMLLGSVKPQVKHAASKWQPVFSQVFGVDKVPSTQVPCVPQCLLQWEAAGPGG